MEASHGPTSPSTRIESPLQRLGRALAWPARRIFDPRFSGLAKQIDTKQIDLFDRLENLRQESLRLNHEHAAKLERLQATLDDLGRLQAAFKTHAAAIQTTQDDATASLTQRIHASAGAVRTDLSELQLALAEERARAERAQEGLHEQFTELSARINAIEAEIARLGMPAKGA